MSNPLEEHKNTLKSHEIVVGKSYRLGEEDQHSYSKIDVTDNDFLQKLTPELSNKIKETLSIAEQRAQEIIAAAKVEGETIKQQSHEQGVQQGIQDGLKQGYDDGYNQGLNDFREKVIAADRMINNIINAKTKIYHSGEDELLEFVMLIAQKLAHTQITVDAQAIKNIIVAASSELKEKETLSVLVNPSLAQKVFSISEDIKNTVYGLKSLKIVEDRSISPDGVVIESKDSRVDARLSTQVEALFEKLLEAKQETPILEEKNIDVESN